MIKVETINGMVFGLTDKTAYIAGRRSIDNIKQWDKIRLDLNSVHKHIIVPGKLPIPATNDGKMILLKQIQTQFFQKNREVYYMTQQQNAAKLVMFLLYSLGILSNIYETNDGWTVQIKDYQDINKFEELFPDFPKTEMNNSNMNMNRTDSYIVLPIAKVGVEDEELFVL